MSDFLDAGRHFLPPNFGCLRQKRSFSTDTGYYANQPRIESGRKQSPPHWTPHAHGVGLSPFPENSNRHVDHDHDYYDLNQKPNRHFTTSFTPPNCPTDPSSRQQAGCEKKTESRWSNRDVTPTTRSVSGSAPQSLEIMRLVS